MADIFLNFRTRYRFDFIATIKNNLIVSERKKWQLINAESTNCKIHVHSKSNY